MKSTVIYVFSFSCIVIVLLFSFGSQVREMASEVLSGRYGAPDYERFAKSSQSVRSTESKDVVIPLSEVETNVEQLYQVHRSKHAAEKLKSLGTVAVDALVKALEQKRMYETKFPEGGHAFDAKSPFELICNVLEETCPRSAVEPLTRFASHPDPHFRKYAGQTLGMIGTKECIGVVTKLLADEDQYVRSHSILGIRDGIEQNKCDEAFLKEVYKVAVDWVQEGQPTYSEALLNVMFSINEQDTETLLQSPSVLSVENEQLATVLATLNQHNVLVDQQKVREVIDQLKPMSGQYPYNYQLAEALISYSKNPDAGAESLLQGYVTSEDQQISGSAAKGLERLAGVEDSLSHVLTNIDRKGFNHVSKPQQYYFAIYAMDVEVCNGGFSQFFWNNGKPLANSAKAALAEIGATEHLELLEEAIKVFQLQEENADDEIKDAEYEDRLDDLSSRYYECKRHLGPLLSAYVIANREHFKAK